ncbi:MAG: sigma-70 family RNA polymerase sigma factor [Thermoanaerobaculia bacterium]
MSQNVDLEAVPDPAVVAAVGAGDATALAVLYDRFSGMLLGLAHRILGDASDAEEILQEAFLQVWNQAERYDPSRSSVSTWLVLITRSRAIDRLRSRKVKDRTLLAVQQEKRGSHTSPEGVGDVFRQERGKRLRQEMALLPPEQREVLEMAFFRGMTQSEIANQTGIPLGTVKTRSLLAMRKLRRAMSDDIEELL